MVSNSLSIYIGIFDINISVATKQTIIINLNKKTDTSGQIKRTNLKESEIPEFVKSKIEFFFLRETVDFFKIFKLDIEFLLNDPSTWSETLSYQHAL